METKRATAEDAAAVPDLEVHLGYWLRRVSNQVSGAFARALLETKQASVAEWVVMCQIADQPSGASPTELASRLELTRGAVSKVIDKLEAKRWVTRLAAPDDGRAQLVSLTRQGRRALPELAAIADRNDQEFFDGLNAAEKAALRRLLMKLVDLHQMRNVPVE